MSHKSLWSWAAGALAASTVLMSSHAMAGSITVEHFGDRVVRHMRVCDAAPVDGARCHSHILVDANGKVLTNDTPSGFGPTDLRDAYNITKSGNANTIVAVVDAYGYSNAEADLAVYREQFGIKKCTTSNGCFRKVNQEGEEGDYPKQNVGWGEETALDLDMVSAMCPKCSILLVQADSSSYADLAAAENTAASMGALVITNSYGGTESSSAESYESAYDHAGIAITVSSGDSGYGVEFPASSPHVTAVGGTSLVADASTNRGWTESAWDGAGSGCSTVFDKPSWQTDTGCAMRTVADVSAVADPATGVAVYGPITRRLSTWFVVGGTSVAAPLVGGIYGVNGGGANYGSDPYVSSSYVYDVKSGSNGTCDPSYLCTAGKGYDGPTGMGSPKKLAGF